MCGIGGILRTDGQPIPEEWLDAIDACIAYRGPDGCGRFRDRASFVDQQGKQHVIEVALVHRRLSIIDHAGGSQPMVSEQGRHAGEGLVAVVFNGSIYNHRELRAELERNGHTFVTDHSDTEVLIHGWREWGEQLPDHLNGMYAFAIWDRTRAMVFLSRDRFGEKPLYYRHIEFIAASSMLYAPVAAFSSDYAALASLPLSEPAHSGSCRMQWLVPYLLLGYSRDIIPGPDCVDVRMIAPGDSRSIAPIDISNRAIQPGGTIEKPKEHTGDLESLLETSVASRLEADVPLGCFLSGGIDSSLLAYFAIKNKPDLMTFSVRMPDPRYDESSIAETVAELIGAKHHTLAVSMNPAEDLVYLINRLGQPFGDSSILPTYWVCKAAREHVKVALAGDGGDELFLGYERYAAAPFLAANHRLLACIPNAPLHRAHPKSRIAKLARLIDMARDFPRIGLVAMETMFTLKQLQELQPTIAAPRWQCSTAHDHALMQSLADLSSAYASDSGVSNNAALELRHFDLAEYLPNDLLRKVDTASMACGLEVRCPFLDRDLAQAALLMPIEQLMPGGQRKGLLRNIARKYLPREIVDRPKMGFAIPIGEWFRTDYGGMKTLLLDHFNSAEPFGPIQLNRKAVQRFVDEHMAGKRDHGQRLFSLLTLSIWGRQVAGQNAYPRA